MGRALGDAELSPILSHEPEISQVFPVGEWLLIGSDGIFDPAHYDFKEAAEEIILAIELGDDAPRLVERAVAKPTRDNATCILVRF
jgi:serine/threonine protein phosphatase PrpC